jgi:hypothetical protein
MRAIGYQDYRDNMAKSTRFVDSLEDGIRCERDIQYLKQLGINTLNVGIVRADVSHATCMAKFRDAGIYVLVGLALRGGAAKAQWDYHVFQQYTAMINSFAPYPNVLGFWLSDGQGILPHVKATARDLKQYMKKSGLRQVPIAASGSAVDPPAELQYLSCGEDSPIDFLIHVIHLGEPCPEYIDAIRQSMGHLRSMQSYLPIISLANNCDINAMADSGVMQFAFSENYTNFHSGIKLFDYFDIRDDTSINEGE